MTQASQYWQALGPWPWAIVVFISAIVVGLMSHLLLFSFAKRAAKRSLGTIDDSLVAHCRGPARLIIPVFSVLAATPYAPMPAEAGTAIRHVCTLLLIAGFARLVIQLARMLEEVAEKKYRLDSDNNLSARQIQTQIRVLRRVADVLVTVLAVALMLMTFPKVRELGASLLASAGVAGLVAGMAARPTLANVIAGIQIALTQPIRLDDVVIVEGEWGRIEEIQSTYVVVRIWDLRRLIVPLSYFIENPFQNWTRVTADILGSVYLYTDYSVPVDELREELKCILVDSNMWDGKVWGLQVTDSTPHAMQLRALMSATDSSKAWDLRCHVRERLVSFLQTRYPEALPRTRAELHPVAEGPTPAEPESQQRAS